MYPFPLTEGKGDDRAEASPTIAEVSTIVGRISMGLLLLRVLPKGFSLLRLNAVDANAKIPDLGFTMSIFLTNCLSA